MKRHPREIMPIEPYPRVTEPPKCKICGREMYQRRFDGRYICPLHGTFEKQTKIEMERGRRLMEKQSKLEEIREWAENIWSMARKEELKGDTESLKRALSYYSNDGRSKSRNKLFFGI